MRGETEPYPASAEYHPSPGPSLKGRGEETIVIGAGGTGGHLFPAEALATALLARGHRVALITDARARESAVFPERHVVAGGGIGGRSAARAATSALALGAGTLQARRVLARLKPSVVVGFGGYPSFPPLAAARLLRHRPRLVLHEQNAILGRANRLLARVADVVALSHENTRGLPAGTRTELTGNPVRPTIQPSPYTPPGDEIHLLILGGSLGARVFSNVMPAAIARIQDRARLRITQQCRAEDIERVRAAYAELGIHAHLATFLDDMPALLASAHLVIARAGGSTVAELAVVGRPSILVPLPISIDDDQGFNAQALESQGAAWMIRQPAFTPEAVADRLATLFANPASLVAAAANAAARGHADAAARLADLVQREIAR